MAKGSYYIDDSGNKYVFHITLPDGSTTQLSGYNKDVLLQETKRLIRDQNVKIGRPKGAKSFAGRQFNEKDIKRSFNKIGIAISGAAAAEHVFTLQEVAKQLVNEAAFSRSKYTLRFNSYTGHLANSYVATVVNNRQIMSRVRPAMKSRIGEIHHTERGARYAELIEQHHPVAGFKYKNKKKGIRYKNGPKLLMKNGKVIRYLRKWERDEGYDDRYIRSGASAALVGNTKNDARIRSAVVLENTAPYADAVQRAHYRVLQNAIARRVAGKYLTNQKQLIRVATKRMLQEAGFNVK